jgi:hypothetical protein
VVLAGPSVVPDPLYLRDVANALASAELVTFVPAHFGMRTLPARLAGLLLDTELLLDAVAGRGRAMTGSTVGVRKGVAVLRPALARRAERRLSPDAGAADVVAAARALRTRGLRALLGLHVVSSFAPAALLAAPSAAGLWVLLAHTLVRAAVAAAVDVRFCWDRSLVRSLPLLPLLWVYEPLQLLRASFGRSDRATLVPP